MSGKSLEDIWRKMEEQRILERQRIQQIEFQEKEKQERARKEYLKRMRMFEYAYSDSQSVSTSSAAAGGQNKVTDTKELVSSQQSIMYYRFTEGPNNFSYFIYNFETNSLTNILNKSIYGNGGNVYPMTNGGFVVETYGQESPNEIFFISLNGDILWEETGDNSNVDVLGEYTSVRYTKEDGKHRLVIFDKNDKKTEFLFDNSVTFNGQNSERVFNKGFVVTEALPDTTYRHHIINVVDNTISYKDTTSEADIFIYSLHDIIVFRTDEILFEVVNSSGELLSSFNIETTFSTEELNVNGFSLSEFKFLGEGGSFVLFGREINVTGNWIVIYHYGTTNTFTYKEINNSLFPNYISSLGGQRSLLSPRNQISNGSGIIIFYGESSSENEFQLFENTKTIVFYSTDETIRSEFDDVILNIVGYGDGVLFKSENYVGLLTKLGDQDNYGIVFLNRGGDPLSIIDSGIPKTISVYDIYKLKSKTVIVFSNGEDDQRFLVINLDGTIIDTLNLSVISNDFSGRGNVFFVSDDNENVTWISNENNNHNFVSYEGYYSNDEDSSNVSNPSGYNTGRIIIYEGTNFRLLGDDFVTDNIEIPQVGEFYKIDRSTTFYNGTILEVFSQFDGNSDEFILFYDKAGELIDQKSYPSNYDIYSRNGIGLRSSFIVEDDNGKITAILFNGEVVREVPTDYDGINRVINDYSWWD